MHTIAIIGGGLAGTLVTLQLVRQWQLLADSCQSSLDILLFDQHQQFQTGIAYADLGHDLLLNVAAGRISAWPDQPLHFVEWLGQQPAYQALNPTLLAQTFLPRRLYGQYLQQLWQQMISSLLPQLQVRQIQAQVSTLQVFAGQITLNCMLPAESAASASYRVDQLVVATGNELPRPPAALAASLLHHPAYRPNPWLSTVLTTPTKPQLKADSRVVILGNGLTMVDNVLTLRKLGVRGTITAISPQGYGMLPHRLNTLPYPDVLAGLPAQPSLRLILRRFNQLRHQVRQLGLSAEPLVDAMRPVSQRWWIGFSLKEKQLFVSKLRHLWGVARHRLPLQIDQEIQQLRLRGELRLIAGQLTAAAAQGSVLQLQLQPRQTDQPFWLEADIFINCTGPESDYRRIPGHLLEHAISNGVFAAGPLGLGLAADSGTLQLKNAAGRVYPHIYALGSVLRGELWESTAVHEIRQQAQQVAQSLLTEFQQPKRR